VIERAKAVRIADIDLFKRCLRSRIKRDIVKDDYDEGIERGIQGTPTFFIAGERVGRNTLDVMRGMIQAKIGGQRL
jgi:Protein-disulfide isomerase